MEVCVDSVESALNAVKGGASRLELCSALAEGGLTPTPGILEVIKSQVSVPIFVMLRPRAGGDFIYSALDVEVMKKDAQILKSVGADGFVFGALNEHGEVDKVTCQQILKIILPLPVTFHRAFDFVINPSKALETIIQLGFKRVLTSGQEMTAENGFDLIKALILQAGNRIIIMPGAGITEQNVEKILTYTGAVEFHSSARCLRKLAFGVRNPQCSMGNSDDSKMLVADEELVHRMVKIAKLHISNRKQ